MKNYTILSLKTKSALLSFFLLISIAAFPLYSQKKQFVTPNFVEFIEAKLNKSYKIKLSMICPIDTNLAAQRVFFDYGAIFVSDNGGKLPVKCIFENDQEVSLFQSQSNPQTEIIGGVSITLQEPAMEALIEARKEAGKNGLRITPRGGSIAGSRSFTDTYRLWNSRFFPALNYWVKKGKISRGDADEAKNMGIQDQVAQVLSWEADGYYFSTGFNKSILYSVAAPGASQHIFMLALDVDQYASKGVRDILADNGWFQTVQSDLPHFTYLGVGEDELPALGLKPVTISGQKFWIPNV